MAESGSVGVNGLDTFPKLLEHNAVKFRGKAAIREKLYGIWITWTWDEYADQVRDLAAGLAGLGFVRGDKLAIIGDNRPRLYAGVCAAQCLGGVPVPMYQDSVARELAYVVEHAEARFALAENQEQVDKLLELKADCPALEKIIYVESRGMRAYEDDCLVHFDEIQKLGREHLRANPDALSAEIAAGAWADDSMMLYTSGTTGNPKGVVLSNENMISMAMLGVAFEKLTENDEVLAYLPMAWVGDQLLSYAQSFVAGYAMSCPESGATVLEDLREIGPTYFFAPPRIFENLLTTVMIRMEDAGAWKRKLFDYFMDVAKRVGIPMLDGKPVAFGDRVLYLLGDLLVYGPLKNTLGFSRIRIGYTAGEAIGPEIFDFYRSLGINMKQLYGQTEASVYVTIQPDGEIKPDTVGPPAPGVELKISDDGEVMYRSSGVFREYYKNPEATAETKTEDGWVHTGDAGVIDSDGHLKIIDRAKDVGRLNDGTMVAPKYIENKLKFFPHIREVVVFGHEQDYVSAFINIDLESVGNWAERNNVPYASYQELASHPKVIDLVQGCVEQVNEDLSRDEMLAGSQIRRFINLPKELDADDGELTRTRKVRRRFIAQRYSPLIDGLYSDQTRCSMETTVTFEDGRTGTIKADVDIRDARRVPAGTPRQQAA